jgi:hypothetical protein
MKHGVWRIKGIIQVCFYSYDINCLLTLKLWCIFTVSSIHFLLKLYFNLENALLP